MINLKDEDSKYIKDNFNIKSNDDMANILNIKPIEVAMEAKRLNLKKRVLKKFSVEDVEIIKTYYKYLSYGQLGHVLNRNRTVIFNKIKELGLVKEDKNIILFKDLIKGYEDTIMFLHSNKKFSVKKIKNILDKHDPQNNIEEKMISAFIFIYSSDYSKEWRMFGVTI